MPNGSGVKAWQKPNGVQGAIPQVVPGGGGDVFIFIFWDEQFFTQKFILKFLSTKLLSMYGKGSGCLEKGKKIFGSRMQMVDNFWRLNFEDKWWICVVTW